MSTNANMPLNVEGLATLLVLQDQVKELISLKEFGYFVTNETHRLIFYNSAFLWQKSEITNVELLAESEIAEMDLQSPVSQWLVDFINTILKIENIKEIQSLNFSKDNLSDGPNKVLHNDEVIQRWPETLPPFVLWSPFLDSPIKSSNEILGGIIFFREKPFSDQEVRMYHWLANNYQYTWLSLTGNRLTSFRKWFKSKPRFKLIASIILIILLCPVRLSIATKAIVESQKPELINAPIPGIIKQFLVKPGEQVKAGQLLVIFDKSDLIKSVEVSQKKILLAEAKLRGANMASYDKSEAESEMPILEAELAIDKAELDYNKSVLAKADIVSPIDGIAVFESRESWIGQPVQAGENILTIEDPSQVELKISVPVQDAISLEVGSEGKFYVFGQLSEVPVKLKTLGYDAKTTPNKILAYQLTADFLDLKSIPTIGSQGIVHLYGRYVPVIYFLLRRPLQVLRQSIGF